MSRWLSNYGMAVVLVLLCVYCSLATIKEQVPTGAAAARSIASRIAPNESVMIVGRDGAEDLQLADALAAGATTGQYKVVGRVIGAPADLRESLEKLQGAGQSLDVIAGSNAVGDWAILQNVQTRFPAFAKVRILTPQKYRGSTFLTTDNLLSVAKQTVVVAVLAVGMTLVIITGGIDLSVGSIISVAAVTTALVIRSSGGADAGTGAMLAAAVAGVMAGGLAGLLSGLVIVGFRLPPFIATLGMMQIASGVAYQMTQGNSIYEIPSGFTWLGQGAAVLGIPNSVFLMLGLYVIAHLVMSTTVFGRYVYATGGNREAARLSGVRTGLILVATYAISGLTAGLGGVVVTSQLKTGAPIFGDKYELYAIAAVVVGGTSLSGGSGKIFGTLIGALIIGVIQNGMNLMGVGSYSQKIVLGGVILMAVIIDTLRRDGRLLRRRRPKLA